MGDHRTYNLTLPTKDFNEIVKRAKKEGLSPAEWVRRAVSASLHEDTTPPDKKSWEKGVRDSIASLKHTSERSIRNGFIIDRAIARVVKDTGVAP